MKKQNVLKIFNLKSQHKKAKMLIVAGLLFVGGSQTLVSQAATVEQEVAVAHADVAFDQATFDYYVGILKTINEDDYTSSEINELRKAYYMLEDEMTFGSGDSVVLNELLANLVSVVDEFVVKHNIDTSSVANQLIVDQIKKFIGEEVYIFVSEAGLREYQYDAIWDSIYNLYYYMDGINVADLNMSHLESLVNDVTETLKEIQDELNSRDYMENEINLYYDSLRDYKGKIVDLYRTDLISTISYSNAVRSINAIYDHLEKYGFGLNTEIINYHISNIITIVLNGELEAIDRGLDIDDIYNGGNGIVDTTTPPTNTPTQPEQTPTTPENGGTVGEVSNEVIIPETIKPFIDLSVVSVTEGKGTQQEPFALQLLDSATVTSVKTMLESIEGYTLTVERHNQRARDLSNVTYFMTLANEQEEHHFTLTVEESQNEIINYLDSLIETTIETPDEIESPTTPELPNKPEQPSETELPITSTTTTTASSGTTTEETNESTSAQENETSVPTTGLSAGLAFLASGAGLLGGGASILRRKKK